MLGQLDADEGLAAALPQGSHNVEVVDSAIRSLNADGTIDDLVAALARPGPGGRAAHPHRGAPLTMRALYAIQAPSGEVLEFFVALRA